MIKSFVPFILLAIIAFSIPLPSCNRSECNGYDKSYVFPALEIPGGLVPYGPQYVLVFPVKNGFSLLPSDKVYLKSFRLVSRPPENALLNFIIEPVVKISSLTHPSFFEIGYRDPVPDDIGTVLDLIADLPELRQQLSDQTFTLELLFRSKFAVNPTTYLDAEVVFRVCQ